MNKFQTQVDNFVNEYNMMISVSAVVKSDTFDNIFLDWLYFSLTELDLDGHITLHQYDSTGKEYDYPSFTDLNTNRFYDLSEFRLISEIEDTVH